MESRNAGRICTGFFSAIRFRQSAGIVLSCLAFFIQAIKKYPSQRKDTHLVISVNKQRRFRLPERGAWVILNLKCDVN